MSERPFDDLALIRKGGEKMTLGGGPTTVEPLTTVEEWEAKAAALRELFRLTLGVQPDIDCPLDVEVETETEHGDYVERRISYNLEPDERVASLALIPAGLDTAGPAVLCIHPTQAVGKEQAVGRGLLVPSRSHPDEDRAKAENRAYALHLVRRGYVTFAPDLVGSGERIFPGLKAFDNEPLYDKHPQWSGTGKDLWDMGRALDVMQQMKEVDADRIGSIGHSQGGGITCYLAAVDHRVKVGVSNCGFWPHRLAKNPFNVARTGWWIGRPALRPFALTGKPYPVDFHELLALAAPRAFLNISALNDCMYSASEEPFTRPAWENLAENVKKVYALCGAQDRFRCVVHLLGHDFPPEMRKTAYAFIDSALRS